MNMGRPFFCLGIILVLFCTCCKARKEHKVVSEPGGGYPGARIMFYNVENLFDIYDDSLTNDNDFLPGGNYHWTYSRYTEKINNIYKVITGVGEWESPAIIGFCEIENKKVLEDLVNQTPLAKYHYKIIHADSPDKRGIDVGMIYRSDKASILGTSFLEIILDSANRSVTREILQVKTVLMNDTFHLFFNHWPSRWGGQEKSEHKRIKAASVLLSAVNGIFQKDSLAKIIITGDFNDNPLNKSIHHVLNARTDFDSVNRGQLFNLSASFLKDREKGTYKYRGEWEVLDQFIVSTSLLGKTRVNIYSPNFLLENDEKYHGKKPFRTYLGPQYKGGFSDHLPVYLDIYK